MNQNSARGWEAVAAIAPLLSPVAAARWMKGRIVPVEELAALGVPHPYRFYKWAAEPNCNVTGKTATVVHGLLTDAACGESPTIDPTWLLLEELVLRIANALADGYAMRKEDVADIFDVDVTSCRRWITCPPRERTVDGGIAEYTIPRRDTLLKALQHCMGGGYFEVLEDVLGRGAVESLAQQTDQGESLRCFETGKQFATKPGISLELVVKAWGPLPTRAEWMTAVCIYRTFKERKVLFDEAGIELMMPTEARRSWKRQRPDTFSSLVERKVIAPSKRGKFHLRGTALVELGRRCAEQNP